MQRIKRLINLPSDTVYNQMDSPVGKLTIMTSSQGLHSILWDVDSLNEAYDQALARFKQSSSDPLIDKTKKQLEEYFKAKRKTFELPLAMRGTPFQIQAWKQLREIPYGKTISYGEQAKRMGDRNKARAVGMANGANPISIVVPCHRVIGSNGRLTGFAGGVDRKAFLLQLEGCV